MMFLLLMMSALVPPDLFVPVGTMITVHSIEPLSSDRNGSGDEFLAVLQQPLVSQGWVIARPGQTVVGRVVSAQKAGRGRGVSRLVLELTELTLVDGQQLPVRTQLMESSGPASRRNDTATVVAGTAIGTGIGAAAGGGRGAAIGAAAGAAAAIAGVLATPGRPTEVDTETLLTFRLDAPLNVSTAQSEQAFLGVAPADYNTSTPVLRTRPRTYDNSRWRYDRSNVYLGYPPFRTWPRTYIIPSPRVIVVPGRHINIGQNRRHRR